ncbi:MAG: transglutaminase domain-containing protein [Candidatus Omnitrophica bacterium]|nr:transglutaminase domain-containing protein [Candidatus Omnitrophota bacterium]
MFLERYLEKRNYVIILFLICLFLIDCSRVFASEAKRFVVRQEKYVRGGIMVSRAASADERIRDFLVFKNISSLSEYINWIKQNIGYRKDEGADSWASPLETLEKGYGDCEDFSFLNESVLRVLGYQPKVISLLRLGYNHAICIFKENRCYSIIDNDKIIKTKIVEIEELAKYLFTRYQCALLCAVKFETKGQEILYKKVNFY